MEVSEPTSNNSEVARDAIPPGYCQCGCGQRTGTVAKTSRARGQVKGEPLRYVHGHNRRKRHRYVITQRRYETPCWVWLLAKDRDGYGVVQHGRTRRAHRVYYERRNGAVPDGLQLDHLCRVPACVNPSHLEPVTAAENCRRGRNAKLSAKDAAAIRRSTQPQQAIARAYGITQGHVSRIRRGQAWRDAA